MLGQGWEEISPNDSQQSERIIQESDGFGLIPRCIAELFDWIQKRSADESFDYSISMSLLPLSLVLLPSHSFLSLFASDRLSIYSNLQRGLSVLLFPSPILPLPTHMHTNRKSLIFFKIEKDKIHFSYVIQIVAPTVLIGMSHPLIPSPWHLI